MLELSLGELAGYISRRFVLGVWLPVFLFCAVALLVAALAVGPATAIEALQGLDTVVHLWLLAGGLVVVTILATVADHGMVFLTHLYEGYWPNWKWARRLRAYGEERQRADRDALRRALDPLRESLERLERNARSGQQNPPEDAPGKQGSPAGETDAASSGGSRRKTRAEMRQDLGGVYGELAPTFPVDDAWLVATRLGNILAAAEEYSERAYGIDAVTVWPRLAQHLPAEFQNQLTESSTALTSMLLAATLSAPFSVIYGLILVLVGGLWWLPVIALAAVAGLLLWWCFHRLALQHAREYGTLIRIAWDLYRHDLLRAVNAPLPASPQEERTLWARLIEWWYYCLEPGLDMESHAAWTYRWADHAAADEGND